MITKKINIFIIFIIFLILILIICTACGCYYEFYEKNYQVIDHSKIQTFQTFQNSKIDVVYTWVNSQDIDWQNKKKKWLEGIKYNDSRARWINTEKPSDEIDLSIESVRKYLPWVNNIYVIAMRPQTIPNTILNKFGVKMIYHDEIFKNKDDLPTFSSRSVESNLMNIPGLNEKFIYFNDDFYIATKLNPTDFFIKNKPILRYNKIYSIWHNIIGNSAHTSGIINTKKLLNNDKFFHPIHQATPLTKSIMNHAKTTFIEKWEIVGKTKFRTHQTIIPTFLSMNLGIKNGNMYLIKNDRITYRYVSKHEIPNKRYSLICFNGVGKNHILKIREYVLNLKQISESFRSQSDPLGLGSFRSQSQSKKIILHHHITHSAGTKLLDIVNKNGLKSGWCNIDPILSPSQVEDYLLGLNLDWVQIEGPLPNNLPWGSPHITFTTIIREPLSRALAGDGFMNQYPEIIRNKDYSRWIREKNQIVDNYNLRWIANKWTGFSNPNVPTLTNNDLQKAKNILDKFDIIMILEDLNNQSKKLKNIGWKHWDMGTKNRQTVLDKLGGDQKLYNELKNKNKFDIILYQYAKDRANKTKG